MYNDIADLSETHLYINLSLCLITGSLLPVPNGGPTVGPGGCPGRPRGHRKDRDHQGSGQVPSQTVCGVQLLRRTGLQGVYTDSTGVDPEIYLYMVRSRWVDPEIYLFLVRSRWLDPEIYLILVRSRFVDPEIYLFMVRRCVDPEIYLSMVRRGFGIFRNISFFMVK